MDKNAIKNYAVAARRNLIEAVRQKAFFLCVFEEGAEPLEEVKRKLQADGVFLTAAQEEARRKLCAYLAQLGTELGNAEAFRHMLEEVAYTWFNRLIALRYMEVNDYLPSGVRILSSAEAGRVEPDAMREAERLPYVDQDIIDEYRRDTAPGASEKLYRYILISQCNALHDILPGMFQKLGDYTELLLPDSLYGRGGIVHDLVNAISEKDFDVSEGGQVQIIGWLYQYYISEKKDEVFAALKKNIKINKETIPAATQLFTPEWIVKYMVENSLGRLWLERHPDQALRDSWKYYVDEAEQEPEVRAQLDALVAQSPVNSPEEIKLIDPCMGSGHILVYAFDVLHQIYVSQGYAEREIPGLILRNNLYGLDIDGRAAQLAYFALMMKARGYSRRFFRPREGAGIPQPRVHAVIETDGARRHHLEYLGDGMNEQEQAACKEGLAYLMDLFADAREYGSILKIEEQLDYGRLRRFVQAIRPGQIGMEAGNIEHVRDVLLEIVEVAECLARKYDVVVTNPPYMGNMPARMTKYVVEEYPVSKYDLYSVMVEVAANHIKEHGYVAMITQQTWMFLSSFEPFRKMILKYDFVNLLHLGARAFDEISGEVVQTVAFVIRNTNILDFVSSYLDVQSGRSEEEKNKILLDVPSCFECSKQLFYKIPGMTLAYWLNQVIADLFMGESLAQKATIKSGVVTGNNELFLRCWYEIEKSKINFKRNFLDDTVRWVPMHKGGGYRKYYGNHDFVMNLHDIWYSDKVNHSVRRGDPDFYFLEGITWSTLSTNMSARMSPTGFVFDTKGSMCFANRSKNNVYILGLMNSKVCEYIMKILSPTLDFNQGAMGKMPLLMPQQIVGFVTHLCKENIIMCRTDWDSFETSWDFQRHPFLTHKGATVAESFENWQTFAGAQFRQLKANEEELNRIFIDIYGLQDELTPEVEDKDVTIRRADLARDVRSFLSYAVGCMFGRYSLDEPGLVFAGGVFDSARYTTFPPVEDNILHIGAADYFDGDIVARFTEFVRALYGDNALDQNLNFIADALYPGAAGSARDRIRRYFLGDFYKDHLKIYQKRPIYWQMDSSGRGRGKKDGFKALFYLHRYDKYTVARARTDYLHPLQRKYEEEINRLELLSSDTDSAREKAANSKVVDALQSKIEECRVYDQVAAHIAHQQIELDLDDGVKVNYAKFQGVEVPMDNDKTVKMDLLTTI